MIVKKRMPDTLPPDDLSGWILPPPAARAQGEVELLRVFDTAEAAMAFLARHGGTDSRSGLVVVNWLL